MDSTAAITWPAWPSRVAKHSPDATDQIFAEDAAPPALVTTRRPSCDQPASWTATRAPCCMIRLGPQSPLAATDQIFAEPSDEAVRICELSGENTADLTSKLLVANRETNSPVVAFHSQQ